MAPSIRRLLRARIGRCKSADHAGRQRAIQTKWIPDSENFLTDDELVRVAHRHYREWTSGFFESNE